MVTNNSSNDDAAEGEALLLDAKKMDGPKMKYAPNDIFRGNPKAYLTYHVMSAGYDYMSLVGVTLGGLIGMAPPLKKKFFPRMTSALQVAGTVGFGAGICGMAMGYGLLYSISKSKEPKIPFNEEGIQTRVDGLSHNFMVRVLDTGVAGGFASAGGLMMIMGGPTSLGLKAGILGVAQGLSLGSAVGSLVSIGCIAATKDKLPGGGKEAIY